MSSSFQPPKPNFSQYVHCRGTADYSGHTHRGPGRESLPATPAKTVGEIAGGMLNSLQVLRKPRTMGKLITNHAYLFIKQGLGEIQRGSAVFTSFNLQPVIKPNTAAGLGVCSVPAFSQDQADPFPRGHVWPQTGCFHPSSAPQLLVGS